MDKTRTPEMEDANFLLMFSQSDDAAADTTVVSEPFPQIFGGSSAPLKRKAIMDSGPLDLEKLSDELKRVVATCNRLFTETKESFDALKNQETEYELKVYRDAMRDLFGKLTRGEVRERVVEALQHFCEAVDRGDYALVYIIQAFLKNDHDEDCQPWLSPLIDLVDKASAWTSQGGGRDQYLYELRHRLPEDNIRTRTD